MRNACCCAARKNERPGIRAADNAWSCNVFASWPAYSRGFDGCDPRSATQSLASGTQSVSVVELQLWAGTAYHTPWPTSRQVVCLLLALRQPTSCIHALLASFKMWSRPLIRTSFPSSASVSIVWLVCWACVNHHLRGSTCFLQLLALGFGHGACPKQQSRLEEPPQPCIGSRTVCNLEVSVPCTSATDTVLISQAAVAAVCRRVAATIMRRPPPLVTTIAVAVLLTLLLRRSSEGRLLTTALGVVPIE